jgi:hypothetical protein
MEQDGLFEVRVSTDGARETVFRRRVETTGGAGYPVDVDLSAFAGQWARIELGCPGGAGFWRSPQVLTDGEWLRAYPLPPSAMEHLLGSEGARFGAVVELIGYTVGTVAFKPGDEVPIDLYWRALRGIEGDYTVFVHLFDEGGAFVTSHDTRPVVGAFPTTLWTPDNVVVDSRTFPLPADLPAGTFALRVGLYELETLARLPAYDGEGERLVDDAVWLDAEIVVKPLP